MRLQIHSINKIYFIRIQQKDSENKIPIRKKKFHQFSLLQFLKLNFPKLNLINHKMLHHYKTTMKKRFRPKFSRVSLQYKIMHNKIYKQKLKIFLHKSIKSI
jgi:hypothetical protein